MAVDAASEWVAALLLCSVRIAAWLVIAPPFASRAVPGSVKAVLSLAMSLPLLPTVRSSLPSVDVGSLAVAVAAQVVIGAGLGFCCYLLFVAVQAAGDLLDVSGGFSLAFAYDPFLQAQNSVLGRFYGLLAITLLLVTDAWLVVWRGLLHSFTLLPLDATLDLTRLAAALTDGAGEMLLVALQIAGPLIAVLFLSDVGLGLATRIAPQLNAFSTGFPLKMLLTLVMLGFGLVTLPGVVTDLAGRMTTVTVGIIR